MIGSERFRPAAAAPRTSPSAWACGAVRGGGVLLKLLLLFLPSTQRARGSTVAGRA